MATSIIGTGSYLPKTILTNDVIAQRAGVEEQWIVKKTGILERRIAAKDEATSDLATRAAQEAIESAHISPSDIDIIIVATVNPDHLVPATACFVQANIGADQAVAFDLVAACAGFTFALSTADSLLSANQNFNTALIIGAEIFSRCLDFADKSTSIIFGDGAGAVILQKVYDDPGILATSMNSDGNLSNLAQIPAGGTRKPASSETVAAGEHYVRMQGREIKKTAYEILPDLVGNIVTSAGIELDHVSLIVPHQMNGVMLSAWEEILGVPPKTIYKTISWSGNTGAASIPIALDDAARKGQLSEGALLLLIAFGAGLTWGGIALKWRDFSGG